MFHYYAVAMATSHQTPVIKSLVAKQQTKLTKITIILQNLYTVKKKFLYACDKHVHNL